MKNSILTKLSVLLFAVLSVFTTTASTASAATTSAPPWSTVNGYVTVSTTNEAALRANILKTAASQNGVKYVFNTAIPNVSFDCSGFVAWVYYENNIAMYRSVAQMRPSVRTISASQAKPGDLIFSGDTGNGTPTHVGIVADPKAKTYWNAVAPGKSVALTSYAGSWYSNATFGTVIAATAPAATTTTSTSASKASTTTKVTTPVVTVTRHVASGITLNVRASATTASTRVATLKGGTAVTGTISNGWMKITSGTYAGRYVSASYLVA